ncbi:unnamed protein product [Triticum turgidum subsp. durum]|nr:unnamed protein product [Triticum turgidum subsp. durum]
MYNRNNIVGTVNLYDVMKKHGCNKRWPKIFSDGPDTLENVSYQLVFSSSATVYGQPEKVPCFEDSPLKALNPYGRTKLYLEEMLRDYQHANPEWRTILLRYFNPIGAHESGDIGEDPKGVPNNLLPYIQQKLFATPDIGCVAYNLGTGRGTTVLEMVSAFEKAYGKKIPVKMCPRRPGDSEQVYASTAKAEEELGWRAKYGIEEMCRDQWNWAKKNPYGYCGDAENKD